MSSPLRLVPLAVALAAMVGCAATPLPAPRAPPHCPDAPPGEDPAAVINRFYAAFSRKDFATMACAYHPDVEFTDSIFGTLKGKRALAMWAMLTSQPGELRLRWSDVRVDGTHGHAHWVANYTLPFLVFDNDIENSIDATFEFKDGKIYRHKDQFDLDRWMHAALWPMGGVISESTIKGKVQAKLDDFIEEHPGFR